MTPDSLIAEPALGGRFSRQAPKQKYHSSARKPSDPVASAIAILDLFDAEHRAITLDDVVDHTGIDRSAALATLCELKRRGFLETVGGGEQWIVGVRSLELAHAHRCENPLVEASQPVVQQIRDLTNETTMFAVRWGDYRVNLVQATSFSPWRQDIPEGFRKPLYIGAGGKILLAAMSDDEIDSYLERVALERVSATTTTDRTVLWRQVKAIREARFAETYSERNGGGASVGVGVVGDNGATVGALVISLPLYRFTHELRRQLRQTLLGGAEDIGDRLRRVAKTSDLT